MKEKQRKEKDSPIIIAPMPSMYILCVPGSAIAMILIEPCRIPAAPEPDRVRPAMNSIDLLDRAQTIDPASRKLVMSQYSCSTDLLLTDEENQRCQEYPFDVP